MALSIGSIAPNFTLPGTSGLTLNLNQDLKGKPLILFFYPKDFTRGCTAEACEFRDNFSEFRGLDVPVFGISRDDVKTHERFKKEYNFPFELLADESGKVCKDYDALIPLIKMPKRVTYLLDSEHKIAAVFSDMFDFKAHIAIMLKKLQTAKPKQSTHLS